MRSRLKLAALVATAGVIGVIAVAVASGGSGQVREKLTGYEETPLTVSTPGEGTFRVSISQSTDEIAWELSYADLETAVTQAHIHFGATAITGGISVFLCTNLGNGPAGTQMCPAQPAEIQGTITPDDVIGPMGQGIATGEFDELIDAMRAGATYANVHTVDRPGGEIRAQIEVNRGRN
jgi:CHRD domain